MDTGSLEVDVGADIQAAVGGFGSADLNGLSDGSRGSEASKSCHEGGDSEGFHYGEEEVGLFLRF